MLSFIADILSIVGFIISVLTLYFTFRLRQQFSNRVRTPQTMQSLKAHAKALQDALKAWPDDEQNARGAVERIKSVLQNLHRKLPSHERKKINELLREIRGQSRLSYINFFAIQTPPTLELESKQLWKVHALTLGMIEALEQNSKDSQWK